MFVLHGSVASFYVETNIKEEVAFHIASFNVASFFPKKTLNGPWDSAYFQKKKKKKKYVVSFFSFISFYSISLLIIESSTNTSTNFIRFTFNRL